MDQDVNDDLDVTALVAEDPDLAYLLPEEETQEETQGEGQPKPGVKTQSQPGETQPPTRPTDDDMARWAEEHGYTRSHTIQTPPPPQNQPEPPNPEQIAKSRREFASRMNTLILEGKGAEAFDEMMAANERMAASVRQQTIREVEGRYGGLTSGFLDNTIKSFRDGLDRDSNIDATVKAEFNKRIDRAMGDPQRRAALAALPARQMQEILDDTLNAAWGAAARAKPVRAPQRQIVPAYGGGNGIRPTKTELTLTAEERSLIRNLERELPQGMDAKEKAKTIRDALNEYRKDVGRT